MKKAILFLSLQFCILALTAQVNTDRVMAIGRNALYFEDYVLSIQYFNQVIKAKPWMAEPYFYRAVAKINLDDYQGAEEDCTLCLSRNAFWGQAYYARGIARQSLGKYDLAIEDYTRGLELRPNDRAMMTNRSIAFIQNKDTENAEIAFNELIKSYPKHSFGYLTRAAMYVEKGDTVNALSDYDKAIEIDPYYAPCYGNRAILLYQTGRLKEALSDLNEAIRLNTRESGYYINRGLVRYQMNDLRGAMADYDQVIDMDRDNLIARFNRGLLRFQVGDNNRAIEDFSVVIEQEPDNYMAYYNRALLNYEVGDYANSIKDFDVVLNQYPNFLPGYYSRSEAKRKLNDQAGADRDYWTAIRMEEKMNSGQRPNVASNTNNANPDDVDDENKTREQSDKNIAKFNRLVVYDKEEERNQKYQSDIRGRIQDRNVRIDMEPSFILTYYEREREVQVNTFYDRSVEDFNARMVLSWKLIITNHEAALIEDQIAAHFASINNYSAKIEKDPNNADYYFGRGLDYMLVQDFAEAIHNFDKVIEINPSYTLAYFNRAAVRYKQMEYTSSSTNSQNNDLTLMNIQLNGSQSISQAPKSQQRINEPKDTQRAHEHEQIIRDYTLVIQQNPGFIYSYYNRGNILCFQRDFRAAINDYNEAILRNPEFAEAYFNRGLAYLSLGNATSGIADLSKAGELGLLNAYSIIKRMTTRD
ncbi:MAG: tetratricopeptide repeat protein [Tannerella sp.]|jgi:tetratricopeptide (TPR) repeat protein|nr:tetratricopeptide repeat protein [Tannerella sp.]